jgi:hypothetical protein
MGIELLNKICCSKKWDDFHELTRTMFVGCVKVQYYNGNLDASLKAIKELLSQIPPRNLLAHTCQPHSSPDFERQLQTEGVCGIIVLVFLRELGPCVRPTLPCTSVMKKLKGMHNVAIMNLQRVEDRKMITVLKVLNLMTV